MSIFGRDRKRRKERDFPTGDDLTAQLKLLESYGEEQRTERLQDEVDRLKAICEALWSFIREHHDLTEADLTARVESHKKRGGETCPRCGRVMSRTHGRCLYCGTEGSGGSVFDRS